MQKIKLSKTEIKLIESMYNNNYSALEHYDFNVGKAAESLADKYPFYFSNHYTHYNHVKNRRVYLFTIKHLGFIPDFLRGLHHPELLREIESVKLQMQKQGF